MARAEAFGFLAAQDERYVAAIQRSLDLFGVADVIAIHPRDKAVLFVQCTSLARVGDRLKRIKRRPVLPLLLRAGIAVDAGAGEGDKSGCRAFMRVPVQGGT
jgi:hypothetical protein